MSAPDHHPSPTRQVPNRCSPPAAFRFTWLDLETRPCSTSFSIRWADRARPRRLSHLPGRVQPDHPDRGAHRRAPWTSASCSSSRSRSGRRSTCASRRDWWTTPPGREPGRGRVRAAAGISAIIEFWNWINDGTGSGGVGLHGDFNMTGNYDEWEEARRLVERGECKLSDYGGELPGTEPPEEWKRYFDWQRQFRPTPTGKQPDVLGRPTLVRLLMPVDGGSLSSK